MVSGLLENLEAKQSRGDRKSTNKLGANQAEARGSGGFT